MQVGAGAVAFGPRVRTRTCSTDSHAVYKESESDSCRTEDETQPHPHVVREEGQGLINHLKRLVDDALKLLAAEEGVQNWIMGGLLRKSGLTDAFIEALVRFLDLRLQLFISRMDLRRAAHAVAKCLRRHFLAEERTLRKLAELQGPVDEQTGVAKTIEMYSIWKQQAGYWPSDLPDPSSVDPTDSDSLIKFETDMSSGIDKHLATALQGITDTLLPKHWEELKLQTDNDIVKLAASLESLLDRLKHDVLVPQLVRIIHEEAITGLTDPERVHRLILTAIAEQGSLYDTQGFGKHQPEAFKAVSTAVKLTGKARSKDLRIGLMQGLVKMHLKPVDAVQQEQQQQQEQQGRRDSSAASDLFEIPFIETLGESLGGRQTRGSSGSGSSSSSGGATDAAASSNSSSSASSVPKTAAEPAQAAVQDGESETAAMERECRELLLRKAQEQVQSSKPLRALIPQPWLEDRVNAVMTAVYRPTNVLLLLALIEAVAAAAVTSELHALSNDDSARAGKSKHSSRYIDQLPGQRLFNMRLDQFFRCDVVAVGMYLSRTILGPELPNKVDTVLQTATLEHSGLKALISMAAQKVLDFCKGVKPSQLTSLLEEQATAPLSYISCQMRVQRFLMKYSLDFSGELGSQGRTRLRQQFERYCWVFTDTLLDRMVALRALSDVKKSSGSSSSFGSRISDTVKAAAAAVPQKSNASSADDSSDAAVERSKALGKQLQAKKDRYREEVCNAIVAIDKSEDLLKLLQLHWLPALEANDAELLELPTV